MSAKQPGPQAVARVWVRVLRMPENLSPFDRRRLPTVRQVIRVLADHADCSWQSWPGEGAIVRETSLSPKTVRAALRHAVEWGLIEVCKKGNGRGNTTRYTLLIIPETVDMEARPDLVAIALKGATRAHKGGNEIPLFGAAGIIKGGMRHPKGGNEVPASPTETAKNTPEDVEEDSTLLRKGACAPDATEAKASKQAPPPPAFQPSLDPSLAPPAPTPKAELFSAGVEAVARLTDKTTAKAKPLVIAMLKATGNDHARVLALIRQAEADPPMDAASWLMGCAKRRAETAPGRNPVLTWATMPSAAQRALDAVLEIWRLGDAEFPGMPDAVAALVAEGFDGEHMVAAAKAVMHSHPFKHRMTFLPAVFAKRVREVAAERGETPRPPPPSQALNVIPPRRAQGAD